MEPSLLEMFEERVDVAPGDMGWWSPGSAGQWLDPMTLEGFSNLDNPDFPWINLHMQLCTTG